MATDKYNDSFAAKNHLPGMDADDYQVTSPDLVGLSFASNNSGFSNKPKPED